MGGIKCQSTTDLTEICILNTSQVQKTAMGIAENMWIVDTICNMFDKMMLAAIQICGLKDPETKSNVTEKDGEEIMRVWDEARRLLMKGKEVIPRSAERMPIPGCSIYRRKHQIPTKRISRLPTNVKKDRRMKNKVEEVAEPKKYQ